MCVCVCVCVCVCLITINLFKHLKDYYGKLSLKVARCSDKTSMRRYTYTTYDELRGTPRYKRGASYFILKKTSLQKET